MKLAYQNTQFYLKLSLLAKRAKNFNYLFLEKKPRFLNPTVFMKQRIDALRKRNSRIERKQMTNTMQSSFKATD